MKPDPLNNERTFPTKTADGPSTLIESTKPAYFALTFSKCAGGSKDKIRVYIELNSEDTDILLGNFTEEKSHAIVRRTGILDFLPRGLRSDWPGSGEILDRSFEILELGVEPTVIHGHNVWVI